MSSVSTINLGGMQSIATLTGTIDYSQIIEQLTQANRAPGDALNSVIQTEQLKQNDWSNIAKLAATLQNSLVTLASSDTFNAFTATVGGTDSSAITATASAGAMPGTYTLTNINAGSNATMQSSAEIGASVKSDLSDSVTANEYSQGITMGTVSASIGGTTKSYTVSSTDTIQSVLQGLFGSYGANISWQESGNKVTITNNTGAQISFGSAGDSSNFFQVLGLSGQTAAATSGSTATSSLIGHAQLTQYLNSGSNSGNFQTPITTTASGGLQINGVIIPYNTSTDTLQALITRINASAAGVTASYDPLNDVMKLTSNTSQPISVSDVNGTVNGTAYSGNIASALGIAGTSSAGTPWSYTINGTTQTSASATIANAIPGVSFTISPTATANSSATITVAQDTSALTKAVNSFTAAFNSLYSQLKSYTGKGGDLQGDEAMAQLGFQYMNDVLDNLSGMSQYSQQSVWGIGINNGAVGSAPGTTNSLQVDSNTLTTAFLNDPSEVQALLSGMATRLNTDLTGLTGQYNTLTPSSMYGQNITGIAQNEQNLYTTMIKNTEQQQQQIYDQAASQAQQMQREFNQLQQYQQQMAAQQKALSSLFSSTSG